MNLVADRKKIAAVITAVLIMIIAAAGIILFSQNHITQTAFDTVHEAGEVLELKAEDFFDVDEETAGEITFDVSKVDADKAGEYEATVSYKNKTYTIGVKVEDTKAPEVKMAQRYLFTNDITKADPAVLIADVKEAGDYTARFARFAYSTTVGVMDDGAIKGLTDTIVVPGNAEELKALGTEEVPKEQGIYRSVLEIADIQGNTAYEEVYIILDTTAALIEDKEDMTITVSQEQLAAEPAVDKSWYSITDNADGAIAAENIAYELEIKDEAAHEWYVHVSHTDRAGNESRADFLLTVKAEEQESTVSQTGNGSSNAGNSGSQNSQSGNASNAGSQNGSSTSNGGGASSSGSTDTGKNNPADNNSSSAGGNQGNSSDNKDTSNSENKKPQNNQDASTWVPTDDETDISPYEQMAIDAGYGNVVQIREDEYAVLMRGPQDTINGKTGGDILREYLAKLDLEPCNCGGGWINSEKGWYWWTAYNLRELITPDEEEFWD